MNSPTTNSYLAQRPMVLGLAKVLFLSLGQVPIAQAAPLLVRELFSAADGPEGKDPEDPSLWIYLAVAAILVLLGGAFAGLTIALMGQDEIYLQVIKDSGEGKEKNHAAKVLKLLRRGKHWVLVTLLLSNVITNETLPIVLDRSLGGGWPAVLGSTVLIVIFGEIAPQSVCVRYGLPIGAFMAPFVLGLMWILAPIAWPTAKLLDYLLGEEHGTTYKKAGLKTLVSLHRSLGDAGQQLNADEVTIISAVLDLKEKPIGSIMTPMDDVFTLSLDDVLDEKTMDEVLSQGYSRIPIHLPDNDSNFVGMLLVKILITYDPEDAKPVRDFALATLPETRPNTSCLDIVNFFQEGKSHMVLVSEYPGEDHGALGVVTLEDVIEELIGEEIVDESDVFVDVHKAIRRSMAAPIRRLPKTHSLADEPSTINGTGPDLVDIAESEILSPEDLERTARTADNPPPKAKELLATLGGQRRRSSANSVTGDAKAGREAPSTDEIKEHLKHLGPSNLASRPRATRYNTVKIKPGNIESKANGRQPPVRRISEGVSEYQNDIGEGLLSLGGKNASGGARALKQEYGSIPSSPNDRRPQSANKAVQAEPPQGQDSSHPETLDRDGEQTRPSARTMDSHSTIGSLPDSRRRSRSPYYHHKGPARSGSITENIVDTNGFRKVVLEMTSSSESNDDEENIGANKGRHPSDESKSSFSALLGGGNERHSPEQPENGATKKKRRRRKHGRSKGMGEREPLLSGD